MIIIAKFASTCPSCSKPIATGTRVEWSKGTPARHADCSGSSSTTNTAPAAAASGKCGKCGKACKAGYSTCFGCSTASKTCQVCGHVERRNARGYPEGDWVRNGECQSCREERSMGY